MLFLILYFFKRAKILLFHLETIIEKEGVTWF